MNRFSLLFIGIALLILQPSVNAQKDNKAQNPLIFADVPEMSMIRVGYLIGEPLKMSYSLPHFMGYRFGLFYYATKNTGGYVDFDYFRISNKTDK